MNSYKRAGILLFVLGVPAFIFLFLHGFGKNEFDIPIYFSEGVESSFTNCNFAEGQHFIPDYSFSNQMNQVSNGTVLDGKISVVNFFFASCPDICPIMTNQMSRVNENFKNREMVNLLSFTVDPAHDSVEVLRSYAEKFDAEVKDWQFLTGDKKELYDLARCGFILPVVDGDGDGADFIHSDKFVLVDGQRRIRGYFAGTDREDVDKLITEINILLTQED